MSIISLPGTEIGMNKMLNLLMTGCDHKIAGSEKAIGRRLRRRNTCLRMKGGMRRIAGKIAAHSKTPSS